LLLYKISINKLVRLSSVLNQAFWIFSFLTESVNKLAEAKLKKDLTCFFETIFSNFIRLSFDIFANNDKYKSKVNCPLIVFSLFDEKTTTFS